MRDELAERPHCRHGPVRVARIRHLLGRLGDVADHESPDLAISRERRGRRGENGMRRRGAQEGGEG